VKNSSNETKRVWKIKKKEEEPVKVLTSDYSLPKLSEAEGQRKAMTYIEKKDIETDLSLKNGPPDFHVFSSEKRISKK